MYECQLGYHLQSLVFAVVLGAKPEMYLHHVVTVVLVYISWIWGFDRIGTVVFFLHDVPDITGYVMKAIVECKLQTVYQITGWLVLVVTWGYFRLVLFSQVVMWVYEKQHLITQTEFLSTFSLLCLLLCLHHFWFIMFFKMLFKYKNQGVLKDISEVNKKN